MCCPIDLKPTWQYFHIVVDDTNTFIALFIADGRNRFLYGVLSHKLCWHYTPFSLYLVVADMVTLWHSEDARRKLTLSFRNTSSSPDICRSPSCRMAISRPVPFGDMAGSFLLNKSITRTIAISALLSVQVIWQLVHMTCYYELFAQGFFRSNLPFVCNYKLEIFGRKYLCGWNHHLTFCVF